MSKSGSSTHRGRSRSNGTGASRRRSRGSGSSRAAMCSRTSASRSFPLPSSSGPASKVATAPNVDGYPWSLEPHEARVQGRQAVDGHADLRAGTPERAVACGCRPRATTSASAASRQVVSSSGSATARRSQSRPTPHVPRMRDERHAEGRAGGRGERPETLDAGAADERGALQPGHVDHVDVDRPQHAAEQPS